MIKNKLGGKIKLAKAIAKKESNIFFEMEIPVFIPITRWIAKTIKNPAMME